MCGGVIFPFRREYKEALAQFYSPKDIEEFERTGQVRSLYWQKQEPVLPVLTLPEAKDEAAIKLLRWGNRDKKAPFPQTGWARTDSIESGKWSYLHPTPVLIPVSRGVEKGKWFTIREGIKGVVVHRAGEERVYMLTEEAAPEFLAVTKHARMPLLQGQNTFDWLPEAVGTENAYQTLLFKD